MPPRRAWPPLIALRWIQRHSRSRMARPGSRSRPSAQAQPHGPAGQQRRRRGTWSLRNATDALDVLFWEVQEAAVLGRAVPRQRECAPSTRHPPRPTHPTHPAPPPPPREGRVRVLCVCVCVQCVYTTFAQVFLPLEHPHLCVCRVCTASLRRGNMDNAVPPLWTPGLDSQRGAKRDAANMCE